MLLFGNLFSDDKTFSSSRKTGRTISVPYVNICSLNWNRTRTLRITYSFNKINLISLRKKEGCTHIKNCRNLINRKGIQLFHIHHSAPCLPKKTNKQTNKTKCTEPLFSISLGTTVGNSGYANFFREKRGGGGGGEGDKQGAVWSIWKWF